MILFARRLRFALTCLTASLLVSGPLNGAFAGTRSGSLSVSLTLFDVCSLNTDAVTPSVVCAAGSQFQMLPPGQDFASIALGTSPVKDVPKGRVVEIAF